MDPPGKQLLLQMECIPTQTLMITFINIWLKKNHHSTDSSGKKAYSINLTFVLSTYRVLISISDNYQLDLRGTEFGDLIGFGKKLVTKTEYGTKLPNITNSIDVLNINIYDIPLCRLSTGQRSFAFRGAKLWNSLNDNIKSLKCPRNFRRHLANVLLSWYIILLIYIL